MILRLTALLAAALATGAAAQNAPVLTITHHARAVRPGEVVLLVIRAPVPLAAVRASSSLGPVVVHRDDAAGRWLGLLGLDLQTKAGSYEVTIDATTETGSALEARYPIAVHSRRFPARQLSVDDAFVNPPASARGRIEEEARAVEAVLARVSPDAGWAASFQRPVPGELTSGFGRRSVLNGEVRSVHAGVDMRAPTGTPVHAPADAHVALAAEHYFAGRLVILDHGLGVFSFLAHLSSVAVVEGQRVRAGEIVGRSGATGRVTGPHLHWSVRVGGARVDPLSLGAAIDAMHGGARRGF